MASSPATYFVSDERMLAHKSEWDDTHIEKPIRLKCILDILEREKVFEKCEILQSKKAEIEDICLVHKPEFVEEIRETQFFDNGRLEEFSASKEDIYVNEHTWESALLAAGSSIHLLETVLKNPGSNGFAAIRPPGHHASQSDPCGFCIFNNVAICAKKARQLGVERVLIFDWDVHAGQGTQYCIEDDPGLKLISIHRFENGTFWPELADSAVKQPYKNTINVPLNEIGYGDAEYAAILNFLVLPVIKDWKPQLILVSCGYDAAIGDPQGEMSVSPGGYAYLTGTLASLGIPLVLLLEGGYFIESVAQGSLYTMNSLIERRQPAINLDISNPNRNFLSFLMSLISNYVDEFEIFNIWSSFLNSFRHQNNLCEAKLRGLYTPRNEEETRKFHDLIQKYIAHYKTPIAKKPSLHANFNKDGQFQIGDISIPIFDGNQFYATFFYVLIPLSLVYTIDYKEDEHSFELNNGIFHVPADTKHTSKNPNVAEFNAKITKVFHTFDFLKKYYALE